MTTQEYRLLVGAARRFHRRKRLGDYHEVGDLISVGWLAMEKARESHPRCAPQVPWPAYLTNKLYEGMRIYLRTMREIPGHWAHEMGMIERATHRLEQRLLRSPSGVELAAEMDIPLERLCRWKRKHRAEHPVYLDAPMWGKRDHVAIGDREAAAIVTELAADPADALDARGWLGDLAGVLRGVPDRERAAFVAYAARDEDPTEVAVQHGRKRQWVILNARRIRRQLREQLAA